MSMAFAYTLFDQFYRKIFPSHAEQYPIIDISQYSNYTEDQDEDCQLSEDNRNSSCISYRIFDTCANCVPTRGMYKED